MKLKIFGLFLILFLSGYEAFSQLLPGETKSNSIKPRNKPDGLAGSFFGGLALKGTNTYDYWGLEGGLTAGGMISDHFGLAGAFYSLLTQNIRLMPEKPYILKLTYGGIEPQFLFKFGNVVFQSKVLLALGYAGYSENVNFEVFSDSQGDWIFITEPSFGISYIIDDSYWFTLDAGWRVTGNVDFKTFKKENLNGPNVSLTFKSFMF